MLIFIAFILTMIAAPFMAAAVAQLVWTITQEGEIFDGWQKVVDYLEPRKGERWYHVKNAIYKPLGGCMTCFRQMIANISSIATFFIWKLFAPFPTEQLAWYWEASADFVLWVVFSSVTFIFGAWVGYEKKQTKIMEQFAEGKINKN